VAFSQIRLLSQQGCGPTPYHVFRIHLAAHCLDNGGYFNYSRLESELQAEIKRDGYGALLDHLRLCGDIPESYGHDSSEEKLYSKYTDALLAETFKSVGLKSIVLKERADAADVEAFANSYNFIADAKSFRLSRTAKNQKDFKIQTMDGWKRGKPYAMVVCPIYQLPTKSSQIYQQASVRNVCIFTYSHLAVIVEFSLIEGGSRAEELIYEIFRVIPAMNPTKDVSAYWLPINKTMLAFSKSIEGLWKNEKQAAVESIKIAKEEALTFLANERASILQMSYDEALAELIKINKIESRIRVIQALSDNGLLNIR
jgi:HindIII restriction endonuclease